jgi:hypothetical protein
MRIILLASFALLAGCGLKTPDGQNPPQDLMSVMSTTKLGIVTSISIVRDQGTKCDYVSIDGDESGAYQPRLGGGIKPVCDGTRAAGFEVLAKSKVPGSAVYRLRDVGTGCQWLWADGDASGDLTPVVAGDGGQVCAAHPPRMPA